MARSCRYLGLVLLMLAIPSPAPAQSGLMRDIAKAWKDSDKVMKEAQKWAKKPIDLWDKAKPLTEEDEGYDPVEPPGGPKLPSTCKDNDQCAECFEKPYADLQSVRVRFEKLRILYQSTKKELGDAIAFGDGASNVHGISAMAWSREKEKIRASEKRFEAAYDAKYEELLGVLQEALQGIASCEESVFGEEAWYDRFGFIYHQFMADRYRRIN